MATLRIRSGSVWVEIAGGSFLPVVDSTSIAKGSADTTKQVRIEVDGLTTATTRVLTMADADVTLHKDNLSAGADPTVNDDSDSGYSVLSRWANIADDKEFVNLDPTPGAAVWLETTGAGGGSALPVVDTTSIAKGSGDDTKEVRFEVDGLTGSTIRVLTVQDKDVTIADDADLTAHTGDSSDPHGSTLTQSVAVSAPKLEHNNNIQVNPNNAGDTTVIVANTGAGQASLSIEKDVTLGGLVDGRDIAADGAVLDLVDAQAVKNSDFTANSILASVSAQIPNDVQIAEQRIVGRITSGDIAALTGAQVGALIALANLSDVDGTTGSGSTLVLATSPGISAPVLSGKATFSGLAVFNAHVVTFNSTLTEIAWSNGNKALLTMTADITEISFTPNLSSGNRTNLTLEIVHSGAGRTVGTWDSDILWPDGIAPTLSGGSGDIDVITWYWNGSKYLGVGNFNFA